MLERLPLRKLLTDSVNMDDPVASRNVFQRATETALYLRVSLPDILQHPKVAIVCGSGLGGLAETIHPEPRLVTAYANIPNFPQSTGERCSRNSKL